MAANACRVTAAGARARWPPATVGARESEAATSVDAQRAAVVAALWNGGRRRADRGREGGRTEEAKYIIYEREKRKIYE